ncbi:serine hydrolase domain-containing protein [Radiobacillus sp. PE A8.2]|uniref:serine hydrolase domain-containing protein n=1 Tax=Radiobacillus sp. PE A8.2 TaxID=3380349 RepID=UPI00388FFBE0
MSNRKMELQQAIESIAKKESFSGVSYAKEAGDVLAASSFGFANRSDQRLNAVTTRFGIASGCKLFTAIAICQLVEAGKLTFQAKLNDCLAIEFPHFDNDITVHHLLTHTAGIPDYFDEAVMDDFEDLWKQTPMYLLKELQDFLPLFQEQKMMFRPGDKFHYNNAGFIILGLIVEQQSGLRFTDYVDKHIFKRFGMKDSGYFSMDKLPPNTAYGYIDEEDGTWRTNHYSIPIKGGADGGAYTAAQDIIKLWEALFHNEVLSKEITDTLLTPHVRVNEGVHYGYGIWINSNESDITKFHIMGYDPGVSFHAAYYPKSDTKVAILSNKSNGAFQVMQAIESYI